MDCEMPFLVVESILKLRSICSMSNDCHGFAQLAGCEGQPGVRGSAAEVSLRPEQFPSSGAEAVESVIARRPAGLVLPLNAEGLSADAVLEILRKLPAGQELPVVVYAAETAPDKWAFIDPRRVAKVSGTEGADIAQAALAAIV